MPGVNEARVVADKPSYISSRGRFTQAQKAGLRYEARVLHYLALHFRFVLDHPWLAYYADFEGHQKHCQPDGIIFHRPGKVATVVEVKYSPTPQAYQQLTFLYLPVVKSMLGEMWSVNRLSVCRSIDPNIPLPEKPRNIYELGDLDDFLTGPNQKMGQFLWKR